MGRLEGKIAVVTGGNSGIGLATAKRFVAEGAFVFIAGRRQAELDAAVAEIGGSVVGVRCDVANLADLDGLFAEVRRKKDHVDVLFVNAGLGEFSPLSKITEAHVDKTFGVNVKGTIFTVQKGLPLMREGGSIILTGSSSANRGTPAFSVYSASKAAIRALARNWIVDLKGTGIRVNVLVPGPTSTPGLLGLAPNEESARAMTESMAASSPLGRMGRPEETASAALFLASDESAFMDGSELFVDGGSSQI
ncbi:MAG: 3-oxoacyl-[acyl-carrier protein] reductase [Myxococcales bacterium]|nr:3-oxoacyl-[acyl-carrier protein] reductase [Myxococcales bacterium]